MMNEFIGKIRAAREELDKAGWDWNIAPPFFITADEVQMLADQEKLPHERAAMKTLVEGRTGHFMGFRFIPLPAPVSRR